MTTHQIKRCLLFICVLFQMTLSSASAQSLPAEIALGRDWLVAQVQPDAAIAASANTLATQRQTRAETLETLQRFNVAPAILVTRVREETSDFAAEHLARQIIAAARVGVYSTAKLTELKGFQNSDGGFGGTARFGSNPLDTAFALLALRAANQLSGTEIARGIDFLTVKGDDFALLDTSSASKPYVSAYVLLALQSYGAQFQIAASIDQARVRLLGQLQNGGFSETTLNVVGAIALGFASTNDPSLVTLKAKIRSAQLANGSWGGDAFLTALALRALTVSSEPPPPTSGELALLVRDAQTLAPLAGAQLQLSPNAQFYGTSNAAGAISIVAVTPNTYSATLSRSGYQSKTLSNIQVQAGQQLDIGTVALMRVSTAAVLNGQVTDVRDGVPIAGAGVVITGTINSTLSTGPDGRYQYVADIAGAINVQISKPGFLTVSTTASLALDQVLVFSPALYADTGSLPPSVAILTGQVVSASNELPIAGALIKVGTKQTTSSADGRFSLVDLSAGANQVQISAAGFLPATISGQFVLGVNTAGLIRLAATASTTSSTISGVITDALNGTPIANAKAEIFAQSLQAITATNGRYQISTITQVPFTMQISAPGYNARQVQAGQSGHGNFTSDIQLSRFSASDVSLESVVMSAPEFAPFSEVRVLGTVRNNGTSTVGLVFNAVVRNQAQQVVRNQPAVTVLANEDPRNNFLEIAAGATRAVPISWNSVDDLPDNYSVQFQGFNADGQIVVEGGTGFRIPSAIRLGGGVILDPPLLQAGLGQAVSIAGQLANLGNIAIPAGDTEVTVKLVKADTRPPLPSVPVAQSDLASGAQIDRPVGSAMDAAGNFYTVNLFTQQLLRVTPAGVKTVLTTLEPAFGTSQGQVDGIGLGPDARLWIARSTGYTTKVSLTAPFAQTHAANGFPNPGAYFVDATGNEYFAGRINGKDAVYKRSPSGTVTRIIDAGIGSFERAAVGPDGALYVVSASAGSIVRFDPVTAIMTTVITGINFPKALAFSADGTLYFSEYSSDTVIKRRNADNSVSQFATTSGTIEQMRFASDGALTLLMRQPNEIRKVDANGVVRDFAKSFSSDASTLRFDAQGNLLALNNELRRRNLDGSVVDLTSNLGGLRELEQSETAEYWMAGSRVSKRSAGVMSTAYSDANFFGQALAVSANDELYVAGSKGSSAGIFKVLNQTTSAPFVDLPGTMSFLDVLAGGDGIAADSSAIYRVSADGNFKKLAASVINLTRLALGQNGDVYVQAGAPAEVSKVDTLSGVKIRVTSALPALQGNFDVDAQGRIVFGDTSGRVLRLNPSTNVTETLATTPSSISQVAIDAADRIFVLAGTHLDRVDAGALVRIDTGVNEIKSGLATSLHWRKNSQIFRFTDQGAIAPALSLAATVDAFVPLSAGKLLLHRAADLRFDFASATGSTDSTAFYIGAITALEYLAGKLHLITQGGFINVVESTGLVKRFAKAADANMIRSCAAGLVINRNDGLHSLNADGSTTRVLGLTQIANGNFGTFDCFGSNWAVKDNVNKTIFLAADNAVTASFAPFSAATSFVELGSGAWWISGNTGVVEIAPDGAQARRVNSQSPSYSDMQRDGAGKIVATTGYSLSELRSDGTPKTVSEAENASRCSMTALATSATQTYVLSSQGCIYKRDGVWLRNFAQGLSSVRAIGMNTTGQLVLAGGNLAGYLGIVESTGFRTITSAVSPVTALKVVNDSNFVVATGSNLVAMNSDGRLRVAPVSGGFSTRGLELSASGNELLAADYTTHRIRRWGFSAPPPQIPIGTIVHRQTKAMTALARGARQTLQYSAWTPTAGGDYEVSIKALTANVDGQLVTGLHVGPNASATITAAPTRVTPRVANVAVLTQLEGGDFASLARINAALIQQVLPEVVYPTAMSMDASGALWYVDYESRLNRVLNGTTTGVRIGPAAGNIRMQGLVPIDSQQRAHVSLRVIRSGVVNSDIVRIDASGGMVTLASVVGTVQSMGIDKFDRLYVLVDALVKRLDSSGVVEDFAVLAPGAYYGLTLDGAGNVYVQGRNTDLIYRITPDRVMTQLIHDATFEYEGFNIAGTCFDGLLMTPGQMNSAFLANGEEKIIVELLGATGQMGPVFNGLAATPELSDIDFMIYDPFASNLVIMNHGTSASLHKIPVTCGAIDTEFHIIIEPRTDAQNYQPAPSAVLNRANGDRELVWSLKELNAQGRTVQYQALLENLRRGESRAVAKSAFLEFRNTFGGDNITVPVAVPRVFVDDLIAISASTDKPSYGPSEAVAIDVLMRNLDPVSKSGRLLVRIVNGDAANAATVATLIDRPEQFGPDEQRRLNPPFNTASNRVGNYQVLAQILAADGEVLAEGSAPFAIVNGIGSGIRLTSTVAVDQRQYTPNAEVTISANVVNESKNEALRRLRLKETVLDPAGAVYFTQTLAIPNLDAASTLRFTIPAPLANAAAGSYTVQQEILSDAGLVLSNPSTSFMVVPLAGADNLTGALDVLPNVITRGEQAQLRADVRNRGQSALTAVPFEVRVLDPSNANAVLASFPFATSLAVGANAQQSFNWNTAAVAPKSYLAVLVATQGGAERVLAQKPLQVVSLALSGTVSAAPVAVARGQTIAFNASARNDGTQAGSALQFKLQVLAAQTGLLQREFSYTADLLANASLTRSEVMDSAVLAIGDYQLRWLVAVSAQEQVLASATFSVQGFNIGGVINAAPATVTLGAPVALRAQVSNTGNIAVSALPVRVEVRRVDTQSVVSSWNENVNIAAGGNVTLARQFETSAAGAGQYLAVLLAQLNGQYQTLSNVPFLVEAPATDVRMNISIQRDARVLVLASCDPGQVALREAQLLSEFASRSNGVVTAAELPDAAATVCEAEKKVWLENFLAAQGLTYKVVLDATEFSQEMRCGKYNVYWLSGGSAKLSQQHAQELREVIYRGEGLLQDGSHDQRNNLIDSIAGYAYRGKHAQADQLLVGTGSLIANTQVATLGKALRLESSGAQIEASFVAAATPAILSNSFGQGHALTYAFDLVATLQANSAQTPSLQLFNNGLGFVAPTVIAPDYAVGSYLPVTTTLDNRGAQIDLRLRAAVNAPSAVEQSRPTPTVGDTQSSTWDVSMQPSSQRSFDLGVRLAGTSATNVTSDLQRRTAGVLTPISNLSYALPVRTLAATATALETSMSAANLTGGEAQARRRALDAMQLAQSLHSSDPLSAINQWLKVAAEITSIISVDHSSWRLAAARLLEMTQRKACGISPNSGCDVLGVASQYNGFFFENFYAPSSDVQGRLAAGGTVNLNNYSIGDQLPVDFTGPSMLVGGDLIFPSGRVYRGDILVAGSTAQVGKPVIAGLAANQRLIANATLPIDFAAERTRLLAESKRLATLAGNTTFEYQYGGLYLHGDGVSALQIFNLDGAQVLDAHTFQVDGIPAGASVLFNISGKRAGLDNMSMSSLIAHRSKVVYNFYQATELVLGGISVEGSLLAPMAAVNNPQGVIQGTIVAKSWSGPMQINLVGYLGCTTNPDGTPTVCASLPSAPLALWNQDLFRAHAALERLEVRGGKPGAADWEFGLGGNTQSAGQFVQAEHTWVSGTAYRYVLSYTGAGGGNIKLYNGANLLMDKTYSGTAPLRVGEALQLYVKSSAGIGAAKVAVTATKLNGVNIAGSVGTRGDNLFNEARMTYFYPPMKTSFIAEGTVTLTFSGAIPTGSRLNFMINSGTLSCNGAAP